MGLHFVDKDVASILEYQDGSRAISDHIDEDDMTFNETLKLNRQSGALLINEYVEYVILSTHHKTTTQIQGTGSI